VIVVLASASYETLAVPLTVGITPDSDPEKLIDHAREVAYHHKASMLQDVLARRPGNKSAEMYLGLVRDIGKDTVNDGQVG